MLVFAVSICLALLLLLSVTHLTSFTGMAVGNASIGFRNEPPNFSTIANQTWPGNTNITINLSAFASDAENYTLVFNFTQPQNITLTQSSGVVTLGPDFNFSGIRFVVFSAYDYFNLVFSNNVTLNVTENVSVAPAAAPSPAPSAGGGGPTAEGAAPPVEIGLLAPELVVPTIIYVDDYFPAGENDVMQEGAVGYTFYFGSAADEIALARLVLDEIDLATDTVVVSFTDVDGTVQQRTLQRGQTYYFDIDHDGLSDYSVTLEGFVGVSKVEFVFTKVGRAYIFLEKLGLAHLSTRGILILLGLLSLLLYFFVHAARKKNMS